ncbi:MAG: hemerythrin domain-containing protein [Hydrogenophaga sp.]|jgi:hemerythrin-like metal-binding protein|uniref:hemerythrin domain-containing protein n=1 Tax=Hydrogenophaga sp. TaxID=1904254 RepID=UPI000EC8BA9A|nr:hemerythrin domain-containing protein [Hydrogenophaga sp.]MDD3783953.1 hemerythrin domain-containing protein [Hydrogenophaga sp.]MDX9968084.1 hemerythrin domain-containing protein [Hydrogenophaga sp.]HAJ11370.1 hemerythrin [Comamonadaceae bacterium]
MNPNTAEPDVQSFGWSNDLLLGYPPMDRTHQAFTEVVCALRDAPDEDLAVRLQAVITHLEEHFGEEDRWMDDTEFPARECHRDEHAAVLTSARQVQERLATGDAALCRRFTQELIRWFPGHADYLDAALSHWMVKRSAGGKPVVFKKDLRFPTASPIEKA